MDQDGIQKSAEVPTIEELRRAHGEIGALIEAKAEGRPLTAGTDQPQVGSALLKVIAIGLGLRILRD